MGGGGGRSDLARAVMRGDRRAASRLLSFLEDRDPRGRAPYRALYRRSGRAHLVGVTGPPGSGKSTLVDALTRRFRSDGRKVAIVAVDPTSPFTGGAILGDRVRMSDHTLDPGVVIRSMASRGSMGGIAPATYQAAVVFDAMGFDTVVIETVGTGQLETDIIRCAATVVVVTMPGTGDEVQVAKAGLFEIGDIFVVNKADREGADAIRREIESMLALGAHAPPAGWRPPVLSTVASQGEGVDALHAAVEGHLRHLKASGLHREGEVSRARHIILQELVEAARERAHGALAGPWGERLVRDVAGRRRDAASAARLLAKRL
ncbi:MAG TPA: methylmalonyl Co-A mutase-associated GTPase MeaB [Candidatus Thermoplasmatota archaeon]